MNSSMSSEDATISVALTTCNGAKYLEEQLDSIRHQTHQPHELVVGDDASTDETVELLERFAQRASFPVRILKNEPRLGVLKNFLHVFNQCQGQYIAYCDQDDVWLPIKLEKCSAALIEHNAMLVSHISQVVDFQLRPTGKLIPYGFPLGCYAPPHFPFCYWSHGHQMVFRRELVEAMNYFQQAKRNNLVHCQNNLDTLINVIAGMYGPSVFIPEALVKFRRHEQTVSGCAKENEGERDHEKKLQRKRQDLEEVVRTLGALHEYLTTIGADAGVGPVNRQRYLDFLRNRKLAMSYRLQVYAGVGLVDRMRRFLSAIMHRAYSRPQHGGVGIRQAAIDVLLLIRSLAS
jgi:glycosyltransferase involved in cell wall biosynthesis